MEHLAHLYKDKKFRKLIEGQQPYVLGTRKKIYLHLCYAIMSQQLSTKVADVFHKRFVSLYNGKEPTLQQIAGTPFGKLRSIGLSNAKATYILNVARFFIDHHITDAKLRKMTNDDVIKYLTQIKGVGQWTVEMILMFTMGREDVFALDDLGIQQSICKLYDLDQGDKKNVRQEMLRISSKWSPYRTYACRYLWGWKDQ